MQKITPFLWFDTQAEEAASFYVSLFPNSAITNVSHNTSGAPSPQGVFMVNFTLDGQQFIALNGGPQFKFNEAVSFFVDCPTQAEVDRLWAALTADGQEVQCGWLKDKFGLSWQIVPSGLNEVLNGPDLEGCHRAMQAMLQMKKLDIEKLREAYEHG